MNTKEVNVKWGRISAFVEDFVLQSRCSSPGWCGSVGWVPACEPKGCWFDCKSGHMSGLWARSPVGGTWDTTTHWCFSPSLLPFSLKINILRKCSKCPHCSRWLFPPSADWFSPCAHAWEQRLPTSAFQEVQLHLRWVKAVVPLRTSSWVVELSVLLGRLSWGHCYDMSLCLKSLARIRCETAAKK